MKRPLDECFDIAKTAIIIANTPLFLANELRTSPIVRHAALSTDKVMLRKLLLAALKKEPKTTRAEVAPYLYSVMACLQGNAQLLSEAKTIDCPYYKWLPRILDYLYKSLTVSVSQNIDFTKQHKVTENSQSSDKTVNNYNSFNMGTSR